MHRSLHAGSDSAAPRAPHFTSPAGSCVSRSTITLALRAKLHARRKPGHGRRPASHSRPFRSRQRAFLRLLQPEAHKTQLPPSQRRPCLPRVPGAPWAVPRSPPRHDLASLPVPSAKTFATHSAQSEKTSASDSGPNLKGRGDVDDATYDATYINNGCPVVVAGRRGKEIQSCRANHLKGRNWIPWIDHKDIKKTHKTAATLASAQITNIQHTSTPSHTCTLAHTHSHTL